MSEHKWSKRLGILIHSDDFRQERIPFIGTHKEWNQTLFDTLDRCFTELDSNNFSQRYVIANRKNCKILETLDEFVTGYQETKLSKDEKFTAIGFLRYINIEILYDRTARDDTLVCMSMRLPTTERLTKEIKILE